MLLFFGIFFTVYGLLNFYIFLRGWQSLAAIEPARPYYIGLFLFLGLSFLGGRLLERFWPSPVSAALIWAGSYWFGAILYFILALVFLDLLRLTNAIVPWFPSSVNTGYPVVKAWLAGGIALVVVLLLGAGTINALHPKIHRMTVTLPKTLEGAQSMSIAVASDVHLGTLIGRGRLQNLVETVNDLEPDLILLPGDIVDEDLGPVIRQNLGAMLGQLHARYGVYAVTGNHEYIGGVDAACEYLREHGVTFLRDSVVRLNNGLIVAGREDLSIRQFKGHGRTPLARLLAGIDASHPLILMDHQPIRLNEAAESKVDLQLSGHTHDGQLWPLTYITRAVYQLSRGYMRIGQTHYYVSSGFGTWGPPARLGNRPEVVFITLTCNGTAEDQKEG